MEEQAFRLKIYGALWKADNVIETTAQNNYVEAGFYSFLGQYWLN